MDMCFEAHVQHLGFVFVHVHACHMHLSNLNVTFHLLDVLNLEETC